MGTNIQRRTISLFAAWLVCVLCSGTPAAAQTLADALDTTNLTWTTGGDVPWFVQTTYTHDGADAVRSGSLGSNQTSWIETTVTGPGTVSYWELGNPVLGSPLSVSFTINGSPPDGQVIYVSPSGSWNKQTNDLYEGPNVLRWAAIDVYSIGSTGFSALDEFTVGPSRPLAITYQPQNESVYLGQWIWMSVAVEGTPPYQYQWLKDGTNIVGATNAYLRSFQEATTNDAGVYSVIVSNAHESVTSSNALVTILPPKAPTFMEEPVSVTAYSGQSIWLSGSVEGSPPFTFLWSKDGTLVQEQTASWPFGNSTYSSLTLTNVSDADEGTYTLVVTNEAGHIESSNAVLTVIPSVAPVITRQPRSLEVAEGVNTWLSVKATGTPDPTYAWTKVGEPPPPPPWLPPLPPPPWTISDPTLRIFYGFSSSNAGVYSVTVSNCGGFVASQEALLTLLPPVTNVASWGNGAEDVFVTNGLAFLARGTNGLTVLDVTNPTSPQFLGSIDTPGFASAARVQGNLVCVADGSAGLQIVSITNPSVPVLVGNYSTAGYANDLAVRSNLVFAAVRNYGLQIVNVTNPASPSLVGGYSTNLSPDRICVSENLAFLSSLAPVIGPGSNYWVGGMLIVDISNPSLPTEVGRWGTSVRTAVARDQCLIADGLVLSVTNPAQPALVGELDYYSTNSPPVFRPSPTALNVADNLAYLLDSSSTQLTLIAFDFRDASEPIPVGRITVPGQGWAMSVDGNYVYVVGYDSPLQVFKTPFHVEPVPPPALSLTAESGLRLGLSGYPGFHYDLEYADEITNSPWLPLKTLLLTNSGATLELPLQPGTRYFRARQND